MKSLFLSAITTIFIFISIPLSVYSVEPANPPSSDISVKGTPEGRDAPIWNKGESDQTDSLPAITKVKDGVFRIGKITVNKPEGLVRVKGEVNMEEGLVEYLACGPMGKLHESVLKLDVSPYNLQVALLLIGLEPGNKPLDFQGAPGIPEGDPVEIWVSWTDTHKKTVKYKAEDLIYNQATKKTMKVPHWLFTGSQIMDGNFMAQIEQSIVATYHDPFAILDHPMTTGTNDTIYFVNKNIIPPNGTAITFDIRSLKNNRLKSEKK